VSYVIIRLRGSPKLVETTALIKTSAEGYTLIDTFFVQHHFFLLHPVINPKALHGFSSNHCRHLRNNVFAAKLQVKTIHKKFNARLLATKIGTYPVILSMPWVRTHIVTLSTRPYCA
jgi:hypothetical protein